MLSRVRALRQHHQRHYYMYVSSPFTESSLIVIIIIVIIIVIIIHQGRENLQEGSHNRLAALEIIALSFNISSDFMNPLQEGLA